MTSNLKLWEEGLNRTLAALLPAAVAVPKRKKGAKR